MIPAKKRNPVCHPQKRSAAPASSGGVFNMSNCASRQSLQRFANMSHRAGVQTFGVILERSRIQSRLANHLLNDQHKQRQLEFFQMANQFAARFVPGEENTNAAADRDR